MKVYGQMKIRRTIDGEETELTVALIGQRNPRSLALDIDVMHGKERIDLTDSEASQAELILLDAMDTAREQESSRDETGARDPRFHPQHDPPGGDE